MNRRVSKWIRGHLLYSAGMGPVCTIQEILDHVDARLNRTLGLIISRVALGYIRYENNRGIAPNYLEWLEKSLAEYKQTRNLDPLLDVAFYAMAEFQNPSIEGTFYRPEKTERIEL